MTKSNNMFILNVVSIIVLFGLNESVAKSFKISYEAEDDVKPNELHLTTVDDIEEFVKFHPDVYVEPLTRHNIKGRVQYTLGARIAGDNLVAHGAKNNTWTSAQNVAVTLTYPGTGLGKQVTYVTIQVDQTSNFGQAYVIKGGLHQRLISIVVEAYTTFFLNYDVQFYGV